MPYLETPEELAEWVADQLDIYGAHEDGEGKGCRVCFVPEFATRIRQSVTNEKKNSGREQAKKCPHCGRGEPRHFGFCPQATKVD